MNEPAASAEEEIFLLPGEVCFRTQPARISTVLGSCVAIVLWEPELGYGGMCHFVMPECPAGGDQRPSGRYASGAMELLMNGLRACGTRLRQYRVGVYGGGHLISDGEHTLSSTVGKRNIAAATHLLHKHGGHITDKNIGGAIYRNLSFDVHTGELTLRETPLIRNRGGA